MSEIFKSLGFTMGMNASDYLEIQGMCEAAFLKDLGVL